MTKPGPATLLLACAGILSAGCGGPGAALPEPSARAQLVAPLGGDRGTIALRIAVEHPPDTEASVLVDELRRGGLEITRKGRAASREIARGRLVTEQTVELRAAEGTREVGPIAVLLVPRIRGDAEKVSRPVLRRLATAPVRLGAAAAGGAP